jgi:cytidyltransferase-like protein
MGKIDDKSKEIIVVVSGGFDPLHSGHVRMFKEAKRLGDKLTIILNNDNWLKRKKGFVFMTAKERKEVIEAIRYVDEVVITSHEADSSDVTVINELKKIRPHIFANGGDRKSRALIPEAEVCDKIGCRLIFNVGHGGKIQSSSELVQEAVKTAPRKVKVKIKKK